MGHPALDGNFIPLPVDLFALPVHVYALPVNIRL